MPDYYGWGSRNLADTSLPGNEWAKEAQAAVLEAGLKDISPDGGQYEIERDSSGKLLVVARLTPSGTRRSVDPEKRRRVSEDMRSRLGGNRA